jgi:hypothetical protein
LFGLDFTTDSTTQQITNRLKNDMDNQWTTYDWTPAFTSPPFVFSCPPAGYLFVHKLIERSTGAVKWAVRSVVDKGYHEEHEGKLTPCVEPLTEWEAEWPEKFRLPDGSDERPESDDEIDFLNDKERNDHLRDQEKFVEYRFEASFSGSVLIVDKSIFGGVTHPGDARAFVGPAATDPGKCRASESARHYSAPYSDAALFPKAQGLECTYDVRMIGDTQKIRSGPDGKFVEKTPFVDRDVLRLKYKTPNAFLRNTYESVASRYHGKSSVKKEHVFDAVTESHESTTREYIRCESARSSVSDCVFRAYHNVLGEAAYDYRSRLIHQQQQQISFNDTEPSAVAVTVRSPQIDTLYADGVCSTTGLGSGNRTLDDETLGLPGVCYGPSDSQIETWYEREMGEGVHPNNTWDRQFHVPNTTAMGEMSSSIDDRENDCGSFPVNVAFERYVPEQSSYATCFRNDTGESSSSCILDAFFCPPVDAIRYSGSKGFEFLEPYGRTWRITHLEHTAGLNRYSNFVTNPFLFSGLLRAPSSALGTSDVDEDSFRFIGAYETPSHQCKYAYRTVSTTPLPTSGTTVPYLSSVPHFIYASIIPKDATELQRRSCREYDPDWNVTAGEKECFVRLKEYEYETLEDFASNIPLSFLCGDCISGVVTSFPITFYEMHDYFVRLSDDGGITTLPTAAQVERAYEPFLLDATRRHPIVASEITPTRYCSGPHVSDCPLVTIRKRSMGIPLIRYGNSNTAATTP